MDAIKKELNKASNSLVNNLGTFIGRENATRLTNAANKAIFKANYRDLMKAGNVVQLIARLSEQSIQICASQNDPNRLIILGNGPVGPEYRHAHFNLIRIKENGHLKFQNGSNFFALDEPGGIPCVLAEPTHKKPKKHEFIRARNEFRLHEVIGSEDWFCLESVYFPGKYVAILPDGSITVTKNKAEEQAHFRLFLIQEHPANVKPAAQPLVISIQPSMHSSSSSASLSSRASVSAPEAPPTSNAKQQEAERYAREQAMAASTTQQPSTSYTVQTEDATPPAYGNLFPTLPPQ